MKSDNRKIGWEFFKAGLIVVLLGAVLGALYEIDWKIETKIIIGGIFFMIALVANEVSRVFNLNDHVSELHMKILLQLILMGKKQGVKEKVAEVYDEIVEDEKKKLDFQRKLTGDIDLKVSIGFVIAIAVVGLITVIIIQELF
jgi:hypothetical protein